MKSIRCLNVLLTSAALLTGHAAMADAMSDSVAALVKQLDGDDFRQRESAVSKLVDLGPDARPAIERALEAATDIEVQERLRVTLSRIEANATVAPTQVTLNLKQATTSEIYSELARAAGFTLEKAASGKLNRERFDLDLNNVPWLDAMERAAIVTGHDVEFGGGVMKVLDSAGSAGAPGCTSGLVRVIGRRVVRSHQIEYRGKNRDSYLQLELGLRLDPRLRVAGRPAFVVTTATDDKNQPALQSLPLTLLASDGSDGTYNLRLRLTDNDRERQGLSELAGTVQLRMVLQSKDVTIDNFANLQPTDVETPDMIFHVVGTRKNGSKSELVFEYQPLESRVMTPNGFVYRSPLQLLQESVSSGSLRATDANGNELIVSTPSVRSEGNVSQMVVGISSPEKTGEPQKITWTIPTETRQQSFPIAIKNIPLPR